MKKTVILLSTFTLSTVIINNTTNFNKQKNDNNISQLYVLGDSLSDSNNLSNILSGISWSWHKVNFAAPFYDNSFTNGDTAAKVLAKKLNLSLTAAWEGKTVGNNYAVAGARATASSKWSPAGWILNRATIENQANKLLTEHTLKSTDEIFLEIGGNDLMESLKLSSPAAQIQQVDQAVTNEMNAIQNLINHGADHLIIANAPNISLIPKFNTSSEKSQANLLSNEFDNKWKTEITQVKNKNPKVDLKPFDLDNAFNKILKQAAQLDKNTTQASIEYTIPGLYFNKPPTYINGMTPQTINNAFFFDGIHPNKWGHEQIGNMLYQLLT